MLTDSLRPAPVRLLTSLGLAVLIASGAAAQTPGSCSLGRAEGDLNISDVFARVFNTGSLFFGNTTTNGDGYLVPKASANSPLYAAGIWVGGKVGGEVRVAAARYTNFTFWPGPLDDGAALPDPSDCSDFDRIYVVNRFDLNNYESGQGASDDLAQWPVGLGAPAVDASGEPLAVTSRDQTLDLDAGERPALLGDETAFWVMNDVGGPHTAIESSPLGIEVRVSAFSVSRVEGGLRYATFYRYEVINRSSNIIEDMRVGFFADPDLGGASDDYVGTDPGRGMMFVYNNDESDVAYGNAPPALGLDLLSGATSAGSFGSIGAGASDPTTATQYYNYLGGTWADGTPVRENGNGYNQPDTFPVTQWSFPADPVAGAYWSEENVDGQGTRSASGDRRGYIATHISSLASGESATIDLAILFAQGTDRLDSVTRLRGVSDQLQATYEAGDLFVDGRQIVVSEEAAPEASGAFALRIGPNPSRGAATVRLSLDSPEAIRVRVLDALGRDVGLLARGPLASGNHVWTLPTNLPSGVYTVEALSGRHRATARWTVVR